MRDLADDLWRICKEDKTAFVGGLVILGYVVLAFFGPLIDRPGAVGGPAQSYEGPSLHHLLGTDFAGQGVLSQVVVGTRPVMEVGVLSALMVVFVGVTVGLATGYLGGFFDSAVMRVTDVFLTIPGLPLIIVIASVVRTSSPVVLAGILSITGWAGLARAVRSQAMSLRAVDFIEAAKAQGLPLRNMIGRQLLPNVGPYVAIHFLLAITGAIYAEVGLFLLGVAPISGTNWGTMLNYAVGQGAMYNPKSMFYLFSPMAAIVLLQVSFVFFTRALDKLFNPRLRVR
jgi:peptide/nickel transport system permease protein